MTQELRTAVVTGAGTGIGLSIARRLARGGARVALAGRSRERLEAAAREIGGRAYALDVREEHSCREVAARIARDLGPISIFVANAGIGGTNGSGRGDRWREIVATNLDGCYFSLRAAAEHLAPAPAKCDLVAVSSILGKIGVPGYTAYCATKAGVLGLVRALALEMAADPARRHVMVNAVCPGWVETEMAIEGLRGFAEGAGVSLDQARADAMSRVPLGRMSKPEDVAELVAWLASPACVGMTGQSLDLNNGAYLG